MRSVVLGKHSGDGLGVPAVEISLRSNELDEDAVLRHAEVLNGDGSQVLSEAVVLLLSLEVTDGANANVDGRVHRTAEGHRRVAVDDDVDERLGLAGVACKEWRQLEDQSNILLLAGVDVVSES